MTAPSEIRRRLGRWRLRVAGQLDASEAVSDASVTEIDDRVRGVVAETIIRSHYEEARPDACELPEGRLPETTLFAPTRHRPVRTLRRALADDLASIEASPELDLLGEWHQLYRARRLRRNGDAFELEERQRGRRACGSFFTPTIVVDAMLDRVLSKLQDDSLAPTVCDPAMGTGAFLVRAFERLVTRQSEEKPRLQAVKSALRRVYGVDLDPRAVEFARWNLARRATTLAPALGLADAWELVRHRLRAGNALLSGYPPGLNHDASKSACDRRLEEAFGIDPSSRRPFHWRCEFPGIWSADDDSGGFDIVLGNPPWVSYGLRDAESLDEATKDYFRERFPRSAQYKLPLYPLFMELAAQLTRPAGQATFIVPDSFLTGSQFSKVRELLVADGALRDVTVLGADLWSDATSGRSIVYRARHGGGRSERVDVRDAAKHADRLPAVEWQQHELATFRQTEGNRIELVFDDAVDQIVRAVRGANRQLDDLLDFYSGCIARFGQASVRSDEPLDSFRIENRRGESVVDDPTASSRWKRLIPSGRFVRPYELFWTGEFIYAHPDDEIRRSYAKSGFKPERYRPPKLFVRQTGDRLVAALDDEGFYCFNNLHVANGRRDGVDLRFALALLNSPVLNAYYRAISMEGGRAMAQTDIETLERLPVPEASRAERTAISDCVDRMSRIGRSIARLEERHRALARDVESKPLATALERLPGEVEFEPSRRAATGKIVALAPRGSEAGIRVELTLADASRAFVAFRCETDEAARHLWAMLRDMTRRHWRKRTWGSGALDASLLDDWRVRPLHDVEALDDEFDLPHLLDARRRALSSRLADMTRELYGVTASTLDDASRHFSRL